MTNSDLVVLDKIQKTVKDCLKKPEVYLSLQEDLSQELKQSTKHLYDLAVKTKFYKSSKSEALPELIINDFDAEQIWQQLELENNEEFSRLSLGNISKTLAGKKFWILPIKVDKEDDSKQSEHSNEESDDEDEQEEKEFAEEETDKDFTNQKDKPEKKVVITKKRKRTTEVDDRFFKLDELDEFLKIEDKKEFKKAKNQIDDSSDEDEESIDLFINFSDLDDEEKVDDDDDDDKIKNGKSLKYADFFDSPESGDEEEQENKEDNDDDYQDDMDPGDDDEEEIKKPDIGKDKKVKFNLLRNSEGPDSGDESSTDDEDDSKTKTTQSSLEKRQERLKKRIQELEEEAISEKPWQLKGETTASSRPQNSLLEEFVEFDTVSKPAPIMTEQTTMKLEDIIRGRIKDKAWDDVEKKFKPVETPMEYKKKLIMNQEKSKESLAQIYENEYIKQREALNTDDKDEQEKEEPPEHIEIKEKMHSLFRMLDALSNFHYTPKLAKPEIKIVSNVPAINMEEVAPVATSEAALLAPEEVQSKLKGDLIGKSERTKTDMKRERRKKKLQQRERALNQSKKATENVKQKKSLKNKMTLSKLKGRNIINADEQSSNNQGKSIKSSTAFFAQLQDQVESSIK